MTTWGCACEYSYDHRFSMHPQVFPPWMNSMLETVMPICGIHDEALWPNSCNLNLYEGGQDVVGWHADNEALFGGAEEPILIISLSLGAERVFELKDKHSSQGLFKRVRFGAGDLVLMDGRVQQHFLHRVPRASAGGDRINLTWRWITHHSSSCVAQAPQAHS